MLTRPGFRRAVDPRRSPSRASGWLACALAALLLPLAIPSCSNPEPGALLNPRPEELPSGNESPATSPSLPQAESCDENPLLAGCDLPDQNVDSVPISSPPAADPSPSVPNAAGEGATEANAADEAAGADAGVAGDAGAP